MEHWTEAVPIIAAVIGAVASVGLLVVAVIALCSKLLSKAIDKRDARLGEAIAAHESKNAGEHAGLGERIDQVDAKITELNRKVDGGFDRVNQTLQTLNGGVSELIGRFKERDKRNKAAERVD